LRPEALTFVARKVRETPQMKIPVNGTRIHVRDVGRGEPSLVFLHYWGGSSRTWNEVIAQLADSHRSIAVDHRGWGESDAPARSYGIADLANDAQGVIAALALQRYVIVGHSMGGKTATLLASRRPAGLLGLILIGPSPPSPTVLPIEERDRILHAYDSPESIAHVRDHILTALPLTDAQKARVIEDGLRGAPAAKRAWPDGTMREDIRSDARLINVPTLVLSGEHDQVDPAPKLREELLPWISASQLQILPGAGHLSMMEIPRAVAQAIRDFISKLEVQPNPRE
jgi:pimeloyl-ACP methyl ester carboxylesterase